MLPLRDFYGRPAGNLTFKDDGNFLRDAANKQPPLTMIQFLITLSIERLDALSKMNISERLKTLVDHSLMVKKIDKDFDEIQEPLLKLQRLSGRVMSNIDACHQEEAKANAAQPKKEDLEKAKTRIQEFSHALAKTLSQQKRDIRQLSSQQKS